MGLIWGTWLGSICNQLKLKKKKMSEGFVWLIFHKYSSMLFNYELITLSKDTYITLAQIDPH